MHACRSTLEDPTTECQRPEGALFCDNQFVDHDGNLQMCIDALRDQLDIEVDASASGMAGCDGGTCTAEGEAKASAKCAVGAPGLPVDESGALAAFGLLGAALFARRRRR